MSFALNTPENDERLHDRRIIFKNACFLKIYLVDLNSISCGFAEKKKAPLQRSLRKREKYKIQSFYAAKRSSEIVFLFRFTLFRRDRRRKPLSSLLTRSSIDL